MTFCYTPAGIEVTFRTHARKTDGRRTDGQTDRRGSRISYLDFSSYFEPLLIGLISFCC